MLMKNSSPVSSLFRYPYNGGIVFRSFIIILTLAAVGATIYTLLFRFGQNQQINQRNALSICEYGLMTAMRSLKENPDTISGIEKTRYEEGWFSVTMKKEHRNDTLFLTIVSKGHCGTSTEQRTFILRLENVEGKTIWTPFSP